MPLEETDWESLTFGYYPTDYNVRSYYSKGEWSKAELCADATRAVHLAARGLN